MLIYKASCIILAPFTCSFLHLTAPPSGAENGTRTRDPQLGKLMLYQLSYFRVLRCKDTKLFIRAK